MNAIIDLMDLELGVSSNKQDASARSKFDVFLKIVSPGLSFTSLTQQNITMELIGPFFAFMLNANAIHWQTSMNYLSSIKRQLEDKLKVTIFKSDQNWYRRCRRNLHHQYVLQSIKTGKRLKDQAAMMTLEDVETMCKILFMQNEVRALMDRTLLTSQWLSNGRSSDIGNVPFDDLHWLCDFLAMVLSGWTDPENHEARVRVESFALEMRRKHFSKLQTCSFTDCLTATALMYLDETLMLAPDHVIHVNITSAAKAMRLRVPSTSELKDWGRVIRKQFVLDNILSLPIRFIKSNMSERELSEQYLGIHTFAGALERGVLGYREVMNELQDIKQLLHRVLDRQYEQQHHNLAYPLLNLEVSSLASSANMVQTVVHRVSPLGTMTRSWPSDFDSVKGIKLQNLVVRYVCDGLAYARYSPRNRIATTSETSDVQSSQALTKFARMVQTRILSFIEDNRTDSGKRRRALTGTVSGIVRAWGALSKGKRDVTFTQNKLIFKG
ncbi:Hypothetical protein PHPALM_3896 [Phytophthora palmivora]|uniref:Uncharacterized protein n=1 Tax=Phytophthora palmivora TaxID=4796 RepID=A0A2P4YL89_9STRA|nr:Hypothetical protein PHPALM_3896 [Phytophthora palmivora]